MQPSSEAFAAAVLEGGPHVSRVVITVGSTICADTYYDPGILTLRQDESSVSYDRTSDTRSACTLAFTARDPVAALSFMDPMVYPEAHVYQGILLDGVAEWIKMGVFGLHSMTVERSGKLVIYNCEGSDRSERIRDNAWKSAWQVPAAQDYFLAIRNIINDRAKGFTAEFNQGSSALTTPGTVNFNEDDDPWAAAVKLGEGVACETYFGRYGELCTFPVPDPLLIAPSISLKVGGTDGILISPTSREVSNREVFNGVICTGEAPWLLFPIRGEIWDDNPLSPTWRGGSFGEKPKKITDAIASTDAQCLATATAEFLKVQGVVENVNFRMIKDPRMDVGDVAETSDPMLGILGRYVLDKLGFPLGNGSVTGLVRRKR